MSVRLPRLLFFLPLLTAACAGPRASARVVTEAPALSPAPFTETAMPAPATGAESAESMDAPGALYGSLRRTLPPDEWETVSTLVEQLADRPGDVGLRLRLADRLLQLGRPELAVPPLRDAWYLQPGRTVIAARLLEAYVASGNGRAALSLGERLVREHPRDPARLLLLAEARRRLGDPLGALVAARRSLLLDPESVQARAVIAFAHDDLGHELLAARLLEPLVGQPEVQQGAIRYRLARHAVAEENWPRALEHLEAAVRAEPGLAPAWNDRGVVALRLSRPDEAERFFRRALKSDPRLWAGWLNLANLLVEREARDDVRGALQRIPEGERASPAWLVTAGRFYALDASTQTGRAAALQSLQRAAALTEGARRAEIQRAIATIQSLPDPVAGGPAVLQAGTPQEAPDTAAPAGAARDAADRRARPEPAAAPRAGPAAATPGGAAPGTDPKPAAPEDAEAELPSAYRPAVEGE